MEMTPNQLKEEVLNLVKIQACEWGRDAIDAFMFDLLYELEDLHDELTTYPGPSEED